jgi:hypothetical protein
LIRSTVSGPMVLAHLIRVVSSGTFEVGCLEILLVDPPHQLQVLDRLLGRLVVEARSIETEQLALTTNAQLRITRINQGSSGLDLTR